MNQLKEAEKKATLIVQEARKCKLYIFRCIFFSVLQTCIPFPNPEYDCDFSSR
jgi:hypothetical protein